MSDRAPGENLTVQLDALEQRLGDCLLADRRRLRRRLDRLRRRGTGASPRALADLVRDVDRSADVVTRRAAAPVALEHPASLPFSEHAGAIGALVAEHPVVLVRGETGCGKSTQLPKLCAAIGRGLAGRIGHTQPRRIAARSIAARIAEETGTRPGTFAGHCVRFDENLAPETRVKVMTDGILLNEIHADPRLEQYDTLIVDEIHERSLNVDFLVGYLRRLLPRRPDLRVVLTSATVDSGPFEALFGELAVYEIPGRTYPVEVRYRPAEDVAGDAGQAVLAALAELDLADRGDVLVFLPGEREIRETARVLTRAKLPDSEVLPLYGRLGAARQQRVFRPGARRRIVLATNVAETSLTVPRVRHVVDTGLARVSRYNPRRKLQQLPVEKIARANADQRRGRCGRESPGICIRLYAESDYAARPAATEPEIHRTNLAGVLLRLKAMGVADAEHFPFADSPDARLVRDGYTLLAELGALDAERALTPVGERLARLPLDPRLARVLVSAEDLDCLAECLVIAAGLSVADPRERPHERRDAADRAHAEFADKRSDFLWFVNAFPFARELLRQAPNRRFRQCRRRFLSEARLREWVEVHDQLRQFARGLGLRLNTTPAAYRAVHVALAAGFLSQVGEWQGGQYAGCRGAQFRLHPSSSLARRPPRWVVAAEIVETGDRYARTAGRIEPQWLENIAGGQLRRTWEAPRWDPRRGSVRVTEIQRLYGLVINRSKLVDYARIEPAETRRIFIDAALLDGDLGGKPGAEPGFLVRNRALVARVQELEARARRRDLLLGRDALRAFYDARLPADVVSRRQLVRGLRADPGRDRTLTMREDDATSAQAGTIADYLFPDTLEVAGTPCTLRYRFEPGRADDGVTVEVPELLLARLEAHHVDRLVPGLLSEKVEGLLRSLPKTLRRAVSPIREYAMACLEAVDGLPGPLPQVLAVALERMTGKRIDPAAFDETALAPHLRMNVAVMDGAGHVRVAGRDLEALREGFGAASEAALAGIDWGLEGRSTGAWTFGELPARLVVDVAGTPVFGHPCLQAHGDAVTVAVFDTEGEAAAVHREGLACLLALGAARERRHLARELPHMAELALQATLYGYRSEPAELIVREIAARHVDATPRPPRDAATFAELETAFRRAVVGEAAHTAGELAALFRRGGRVRERLDRLSLAPTAAADDIRSQVAWLLGPSLVPRILARQTGRYGSYFDAIERRLERLEANPGKDLGKLERVQPVWSAFMRLADGGVPPARARTVHAAIEEFRIATFAPELGAATRVSVEEIASELEALERSP